MIQKRTWEYNKTHLKNQHFCSSIGRETFEGINFKDCKIWPYKVLWVLVFVDPKWEELDVALRIVADRYYEFAIPTSVKGYHEYKDVWEAIIEENLPN